MLIEDVLKLEQNKSFEGTFAVVNVSLKPFKEKEGNYLAFFLQDKTGRIPAKIWENAESFKDVIKEDVVIDAKGKTNIFSGKNQAVLDSFEVKKEYDIKNFLLASKLNVEEMLHELKCILFSEMNVDLSKFLEEAYFKDPDFLAKFILCPGGKGEVHHSYIHGLLEHTLGVLKLCQSFYEEYPNAEVDIDLLKAAAFLHDLGKIYAYSYKISIEMTDVGRLHGHICLGYFDFLTKINDFDGIDEEKKSEYKKLLGHMILSHHGSYDKQAAVLPMTLEAALLCKADSIDADVNYISGMIEGSNEDWTPFSYLVGKSFYKKKEVKEEEVEPKKIIKKKSKTSLYDYKE
jgi:3'-5' exoribonuclease